MIGAVVIGRNEGTRLIRCLEALVGRVDAIVYVDSGSSDDSVREAEKLGAEVVELDLSQPFTAARARNAGLDRLRAIAPTARYVQFLDGDCVIRSQWLQTAKSYLDAHPENAVACGRRRERFPEASLWNRLIDLEWDAPPGPAKACGGDALMRISALDAVGGFNPGLIAGEEPELCVRLRAAGWKIERLAVEMTWHDAAMTRFSQWWARARRAGHAAAEGMALHGAPPERHGVRATLRAVVWGGVLPVGIVAGALITPWMLVACLVYPMQFLRLALRSDDSVQAFFLVLAKFPEAQGVGDYWLNRLRGRQRALIEYK